MSLPWPDSQEERGESCLSFILAQETFLLTQGTPRCASCPPHDLWTIKLHLVHSSPPQLQHISEDQHLVLMLCCAKSPSTAAPTAPAGVFSSFGLQPWGDATPWLATTSMLPI